MIKLLQAGGIGGTVNPALPPFNADGDATKIKESLSGAGTNEKALIDILSGRSDEERQQIVASYEKLFGKKLADDCKSETTLNLEKILVAVLKSDVDFDVWLLRNAIEGLGTKEDVLIETLATRSNDRIKAVKAKYLEKYGKPLESDIKGDTTGDFEKILVAFCDAARNETVKDEKSVDQAKAKRQAIEIFEAGTNRFGTNESVFIRTFLQNSLWENRALITEYKALGGPSLYEAITAEVSGHFRDALLAAVDPQWYIAGRFGGACSGIGTDDSALIRLCRGLPRDLLFRAKIEYFNREREGLVARIEKETSGDYRRLLTRLTCCSKFEYKALLVREATRGFGTDDASLIDILASTPPAEMELVNESFLISYGVKLGEALKSESSGSYADFLEAIVRPKHLLIAKEIHRAVNGVGTNEDALIEIFTSRPSSEIPLIAQEFNDKYKKKGTLIETLSKDLSGNFEHVIMALAKGGRRVGMNLKAGEAESIADQLYKATEKKMGTDDDALISIITTYSPEELQKVDEAYNAKRGKSVKKVIKDETSGNYCESLIACFDPLAYAAKMLRETMKGVGTDEETLIRIIATRTREEMKVVEARYQEKFEHPLKQDIKGDLSGNFRTAVLAYLGHMDR